MAEPSKRDNISRPPRIPAAALAKLDKKKNNNKMDMDSEGDEDESEDDMEVEGVDNTKKSKNKKKTERDLEVELGDDYQVKIEVGGTVTLLDEWQPYLINGLPMGEHTVTLSLVDGDGALVQAPHNPINRTSTLSADPLPQG